MTDLEGVSLAIPFFNEEAVLATTLDSAWAFLKNLGRPFELILADDGSTDSSPRIAREFLERHTDGCRMVRNGVNTGRGSVLSKAFAASRMPVAMYIDADLEIALRFAGDLLAKLDDPAVVVCTGTKLTSEQHGYRAYHRMAASRVFNYLIRMFLHSHVSDHQCGLKGFRRSVLPGLMSQSQEKGWAWDTEILLLARKAGYRVHEVPVELSATRRSKVAFFKTVVMFAGKLIEFRRRGLVLR